MSETGQQDILDVLALLEIQSVTCGKARVGGDNDGGYVMANDFECNLLAYSIGVGPQVIWDVDMANRGMIIYQYDHTVPGLPEEHAGFRFQPLGIGPDMSDAQLITLEEMLRRNQHLNEQNMLLKIDVEGAEWEVFDQMDYGILSKFDQIVIEFHGLEHLSSKSFLDRCTRVFKKLNFHHVPIHIHANNYGGTEVIEGIFVPRVIELSYARRDRFTFSESEEIFPTVLDQPCRADQPDIFLGRFKHRRKAA
jgi:hypothetical protein